MLKNLALSGIGILCAASLTAGSMAAPPVASSLDRSAAALRGRAAADAASISQFVKSVRVEAETPPVAPPRTLQDAVGRVLQEIEGAPRCLTPILTEVERQSGQSQALASYVGP